MLIGETISHYKILAELGTGGMGAVYKAEDTRLKRAVALKFLQIEGLDDRARRAGFLREARTAATLNHPNICTVHEIDENEHGIFIAMQYVDGTDLRHRLQKGPLTLEEAVSIAAQVACGLEAAHDKGIIHRDVKDANIMVATDGRAMIMDFGLATVRGSTSIADSATVGGTLAYMSPEQLRGEHLDERTDVWSLGVVLYEMFTGTLPFAADYETALGYAILNEDAPLLAELRPGIPFGLELIAETAMSKNREDRYQTMTDMRVELQAALENPDELSNKAGEGDPALNSVAVLPFADMSEEKDQEYFCDGMTEEIINALTQLKHLRVVSRTSSFAFKGKLEDVRVIGRKLGVKHVLEGSVRKSGTHVRITAQLINVASGYHTWSEQYDRELSDVFEIQDEIGRSIVEALQLELSDKEMKAMHKPATADVEAYEYYLRGRRLFFQTRRSNLTKAKELYAHAIEKDPKFARAHAGMADCHSYLCWYYDRSKENLESALSASARALELDPELPEAYAARGLALTLNEQYAEAEKAYEEAVKRSPGLFEAYYFHARTRFVQGDMEGAARLFGRACEANPQDYQASMMLGFVLSSLKLKEKAYAAYRHGLKNVEKHLAAHPDDSRAFYLGSSALIDLGEREKGLQYSMRAVSLDPNDSYILYGVACNFCRLGEREEGIYYFERALREGFAHKEWIENDSDLDPIRDDPRFRTLVDELVN